MIINNKAIGLWRGSDPPINVFHLWIKNESQLLIYNGTEWVVLLDDTDLISKLDELFKKVEVIQAKVDVLDAATVNSKPIKSNPVLNGNDIKLGSDTILTEQNDNINQGIDKLIECFKTKRL